MSLRFAGNTILNFVAEKRCDVSMREPDAAPCEYYARLYGVQAKLKIDIMQASLRTSKFTVLTGYSRAGFLRALAPR
jgi:hypothetical protein